ncbi:hypothetical protein ACFWIX_07365 [Pseudarthrobacter sp. NPDC058362]|uniref:hypothetical protein n=1 Tax=Pseudarthrobacter sp. NPDC058362 TaxID=3346458 RepID=UPI0036519BE3
MSGPQEPYPSQQPRLPHGLPPVPDREPQQSPGQDDDGGVQPGGRRKARAAARAEGRVPGRPRPMVLLAGTGGLVLLLVLGIIIAVNVTGSTSNQARGLAKDFTDLVIAGDTAKAYREYLDPALQEQLSKEQFMTGIGTLKLTQSCEPAFNDFTVDNDGGTRRADVTGLITCGDRKTDLSYRFEGADQLKMTSITLRPAG